MSDGLFLCINSVCFVSAAVNCAKNLAEFFHTTAPFLSTAVGHDFRGLFIICSEDLLRCGGHILTVNWCRERKILVSRENTRLPNDTVSGSTKTAVSCAGVSKLLSVFGRIGVPPLFAQSDLFREESTHTQVEVICARLLLLSENPHPVTHK